MKSIKQLKHEIEREKECRCDADDTCVNCLNDCLLTAELKGRQEIKEAVMKEIELEINHSEEAIQTFKDNNIENQWDAEINEHEKDIFLLKRIKQNLNKLFEGEE